METPKLYLPRTWRKSPTSRVWDVLQAEETLLASHFSIIHPSFADQLENYNQCVRHGVLWGSRVALLWDTELISETKWYTVEGRAGKVESWEQRERWTSPSKKSGMSRSWGKTLMGVGRKSLGKLCSFSVQNHFCRSAVNHLVLVLVGCGPETSFQKEVWAWTEEELG